MNTTKFSDDLKRDAVHQIVERGYPVAEVSKRLGVSPHSLYAWKQRFAMSLDVAQIQEAQAKTPGLLGPRQSDQQIGNMLFLVVQLCTVTITGLADLEGEAGKRNAHPSQRHCLPVHLPALRWPRHFLQGPPSEALPACSSQHTFSSAGSCCLPEPSFG